MDIEKLRQEFQKRLATVHDSRALEELRNDFVGRKRGAITSLLKELPKLLPEDRAAAGKQINELKELVEQQLGAKRAELERPSAVGEIDWTLPGYDHHIGAIHPLTFVRHKIEDIFREMGYAIAEGPEMETDFHNFGALNFPEDHPARDT